MSTATLDSSRPAAMADSVQPKAAARLLFVDNMRVFLTILVLLHHTMIIYAGTGSFLYTEGRQDTITSVLGDWFCTVNQAYFMSLFLLISAYFVPGSYDRKGASHFLKDRLIRLGIPLIIYSWIISPLTWVVITSVTQGQTRPWWTYLPGVGDAVIGAGPLWFVEVLLILSLVYTLWRRLFQSNPPAPPVDTQSQFPGNAVIAVFALLTGVGAFLVRLVFPVDWNFSLLNLQFPFFVLYIAMFIVGLDRLSPQLAAEPARHERQVVAGHRDCVHSAVRAAGVDRRRDGK